MQSVMWPPIAIATDDGQLVIRVATQADAATLARWDEEPSVIACTTDDPNAERLGFKPIGRRVFNDEDDCLVHRLERADWRGGK